MPSIVKMETVSGIAWTFGPKHVKYGCLIACAAIILSFPWYLINFAARSRPSLSSLGAYLSNDTGLYHLYLPGKTVQY
jgi:hypothetical protein